MHTEDHLTTTDQGVTMLRRLMTRVAKEVAEGANPPGVAFDERDALVRVRAGNYITTSDGAQPR